MQPGDTALVLCLEAVPEVDSGNGIRIALTTVALSADQRTAVSGYSTRQMMERSPNRCQGAASYLTSLRRGLARFEIAYKIVAGCLGPNAQGHGFDPGGEMSALGDIQGFGR